MNTDRLKNIRMSTTPKDKNRSKVFCIAPWMTMHVLPTSETLPCCVTRMGEGIGDVRKNTMEEIWNSNKMKKIRLDMLNDIPIRGCERCYEQEKSGAYSLRVNLNRTYLDEYGVVLTTKEDGYVDKFNLKYLDVRFSNLCNFICRYCSHGLSSAWYEDAVTLGETFGEEKVIKAGNSELDLYKQIESHLPTLKEIYFAGGEPLLQEEHFKILKKLIELGRTNINIIYATNFSKLIYKGEDVLDLWSKFDDNCIQIGASLDGVGKRGEYMRSGQVWKDVEKNIKKFYEKCSTQYFHIIPTLTCLNVWSFPDMHKYLIEKELVNPHALYINLLTDPVPYRIQIFPRKMKDEIKKKYLDHIDWITKDNRFGDTSWIVKLLNSVIDFMYQEDLTKQIPIFLRTTHRLDKMRKESFKEVFPEYGELYLWKE